MSRRDTDSRRGGGCPYRPGRVVCGEGGCGENGEAVKIAPAVGNLIIELLGHVSNGNMVTLVPVGTMLTTQEAADMLNISRPYLTKLLLRGDIRFEQVGSHRRVRIDELMRYRADKARKQESALADLARLGQEFDNE